MFGRPFVAVRSGADYIGGLCGGDCIGRVGEVSSILLASQLRADLVLMDDRRARALALKLGATPMGCVGLLQAAFQAGFVTDLRHAYRLLLASGAYVDRRIIEANLELLRLPGLDL